MLLITPHLALNFNEESLGDDPQSRLASFTGADHHAPMQFSPGTATSGFSASTFQFVDGPLEDRPIGEEGLDEVLDLINEMKKALPESTEFLSLGFRLYAHNI